MTPLIMWILMSFAAFRLTRLITKDTFPPVLWVRDRLAGGWRPMTDAEFHARRQEDGPKWPIGKADEKTGRTTRYVTRAAWSPYWLAELITCPWCASAYVSGCVVGVTDLVSGLRWPWLMGFAVWAGASILASREWL